MLSAVFQMKLDMVANWLSCIFCPLVVFPKRFYTNGGQPGALNSRHHGMGSGIILPNRK